MVDQQAFMLAANDVFYASAVLFLLLIPFVWLSKPTKSAGARRRRRRALNCASRGSLRTPTEAAGRPVGGGGARCACAWCVLILHCSIGICPSRQVWLWPANNAVRATMVVRSDGPHD